jgi:hypothetical protein
MFRIFFLGLISVAIAAQPVAADDRTFRDAERTIEALDFLAKHPEKGCELHIYDCKPGWEERLAECQAARRLADQMQGLALIGMDEVCARWQTGEPPKPKQAPKAASEKTKDPAPIISRGRGPPETPLCAGSMTRDGCQLK